MFSCWSGRYSSCFDRSLYTDFGLVGLVLSLHLPRSRRLPRRPGLDIVCTSKRLILSPRAREPDPNKCSVVCSLQAVDKGKRDGNATLPDPQPLFSAFRHPSRARRNRLPRGSLKGLRSTTLLLFARRTRALGRATHVRRAGP
jgi:hypothetical protein